MQSIFLMKRIHRYWFKTVMAFFLASFFCRSACGSGNGVEIHAFRVLAEAESLRMDGLVMTEGSFVVSADPVWHFRLQNMQNGSVLFDGPVDGPEILSGETAVPFCIRVEGLSPELWEPDFPHLYAGRLEFRQNGDAAESKTFTVGFRTIEARDGQIFLNGRPIFLRGLAINPPDRGMPDEVGMSAAFAAEYIGYLKELGVNAVRLGTENPEWLKTWLSVCDELGMLVFQGRYGNVVQAPRSGQVPPREQWDSAVAEYKERVFGPLHSHPSVCIYVLSNEQPYRGKAGEQMNEFLEHVWQVLREWDPTRLYIGNTGFGHGIGGEIWSMHPYHGWYGGSFLGLYRKRDYPTPAQQQTYPSVFLPDGGGVKPLILTECVGTYPNSTDGFRMENKQYAAALRWGGLFAQDEDWAEDYQRFQVQRKTEMFRRLRRFNPQLVAITPFTNLLRWWSGVTSFAQMEARPALEQMRYSFSPILLSWEHWQPHLNAGAPLDARLHLLHEDRTRDALTGMRIHWRVQERDPSGEDPPQILIEDEITVPEMAYGEILVFDVEAVVPPEIPSGDYLLVAMLKQGDDLIAANVLELYLESTELGKENQANGARIAAGPDAMERLATFAERRGWDLRHAASGDPLVLTREDLTTQSTMQTALNRLYNGGTVLVMYPNNGQLTSLGVNDRLAQQRPPAAVAAEIAVQLRRSEFGNERLRMWSDYTGWKEGDEGLPAVTPVRQSYRLVGDDAAGRVAVLASIERGLEGVVLCETDVGQGRLVICGFDILPRIGLDPVADHMMHNLLLRIHATERPPVIPERTDPVYWGNLRSERGLIVTGRQGFAPHTEPAPPNAQGLGDMLGGFHRLVGRRLSSTYSFNAHCHLVEDDPNNPVGFGRVWMRPPSGARRMLTEVRNTGNSAATFSIRINGELHGTDIVVPARETLVHEANIRDVAGDFHELEYRGTRGLVFVRTEFRN